MAWPTDRVEAAKPFFPPEVAVHLVKIACERPDRIGRSLSQWDCREPACQLQEQGVVLSISPETVRRILANHHLKPWRTHYWITPRSDDSEFRPRIQEIIDLYTGSLPSNEVVLCVDEKTSLQPRVRVHPTRPAIAGRPNLVEHEYKRQGALNLFAAFDTRSERVHGRKCQVEFIAFLEHLDHEVPAPIETIHIVCDNVPTHHGKQVRQWLQKHPRFRFHFTPVHCSWMNQVEQWFSILQRKRFRLVDFDSKEQLRSRIDQFVTEWNAHAHPFNWSKKSVATVMADLPANEAA
jgi:transposase